MSKTLSRSAVAVLALTVGMTGLAQAEPLNIWSASRQADVSAPQVEQIQHRSYYGHRRHNGISPGAAAAIGIGAFAAGAAIASQRDRYYYDDRGGYYEGRSSYREPRRGYCDTSHLPKHYPAPAGC